MYKRQAIGVAIKASEVAMPVTTIVKYTVPSTDISRKYSIVVQVRGSVNICLLYTSRCV